MVSPVDMNLQTRVFLRSPSNMYSEVTRIISSDSVWHSQLDVQCQYHVNNERTHNGIMAVSSCKPVLWVFAVLTSSEQDILVSRVTLHRNVWNLSPSNDKTQHSLHVCECPRISIMSLENIRKPKYLMTESTRVHYLKPMKDKSINW